MLRLGTMDLKETGGWGGVKEQGHKSCTPDPEISYPGV